MSVPNSVIPDSLQGEYFNDPVLPIPEQETGIFDLLSTGDYSGAEVSVNTLENKLSEFAGAPTSIETLSAPRFFDYDATQADRYKQSSNFTSIGFNPTIGTENEYRYGARQTWGDVWSNGLAGMFSLAGNTYVEGWKGWGHLVDAIAAQDFSKIVGSEEELLAQDKTTKDILNKYAIFSTPESEEGLFNRKFFGDMLQQSGFAVGAISQFLTEELITWGLSTEFSLAKLGLKSSAWAGRVVSHADVAEDLVKLGNPVWKSKSFTEGAVQSARQFIPLANTAYTMSKYGKAGAGALQMAAIGVGGVRRLLSEVNMAMTEARMESAGTYGELYNKLYDESLRYTGQAPIGSELESIKKNAMDAAYDNFNVNTGILMLSNRLQFNNVFSRFGTGRGFFGTTGEFADDVLKVTGKSAGKEAAEQTSKVYVKGKLGTLGLTGQIAKDFGGKTAAWEATKSLGRNIFKWETTEGLQELFQEGSNKGLSDYYYDLYHGNKGHESRMQAILEGIDNPLTNIQGAKTFLMGALTGRLLSPINFTVGQIKKYAGTTALDRLSREVKLKESVSLINAFYQNPEKFLNEHIANVKVQDRAAKNMEEAIRNRDKYEFVNNKDGAFAKMMSAAMKTDMFKAITNTIREYGDSFSDEEFKQAFGLDKNEENISSVKEYFNKIADETESFHKTWKQLKDKYGDSVMVDLYKEGTPERKTALMAKRALDDAIEMLATNNYRATRATERAVKLQQDIGTIPQLGNSAAIGFRVLGVEGNAQKEVEILKREIQNLEDTATKDKATRELIKAKKMQLKSIQNWLENAPALREMGRKQKRKYNKARTALEDYMNSQNQQAGVDVTVKADDIQDIYDKLIDYMDLNKDSKDYIDAYNILANPIQFVRVHQRLMEAMDDAGKKLEDEHKQEADDNIQGKPPLGTKNTPAPIGVHTVRPESNNTFTVVSPMGNVVLKDLPTEEEAKQRAKELDEILAEEGRKNIPDRPEGLDKDAKVIKFGSNIYLIEEMDTDGDKFWYIINRKGEPIVNLKLDKTTESKYPDYSPEMVIPSLEQALDIYEALQRNLNKEVKEFQFDGQTIKFGDILIDEKNRKYKILTKGEPITHKGKEKIVIQPLSGAMSTYTIESLKGYRLESQTPESMQPEDPNAFRLQRNNELVRVYAVKLPGENQDTANARLKSLIHETPKNDLAEGISIRVTKNKDLGPVTKASFNDGSGVNNRLQQNPEPYKVEIMYGGQTIGFATYYNRYSYINNEGKQVRLDNITKKEFVQIFDVSNKNIDTEYDRFKTNFKASLAFHTALAEKLGEQESITLSPEETSATFSFIPSAGEYAFATDRDARVSLDNLNYNTIDGYTYILDRRTRYLGEGMYEEDPRVQTDALDTDSIEERVNQARYVNGEDKLRNYGRYVAVVELPNGSIKFVEIQSVPSTKEELDVIIDKINQQSRTIKQNNLEKKTDPKTKKTYYSGRNSRVADDINNEISDSFYITVGGRRGMRVNMQLLPTGNIKVEFATFFKGSTKPEKREVVITESETDPTKPLQIKDSADLIERINNAVSSHDANPKNVVKKINIGRFNLTNFKRSIPDNAAISEYRQMLAGTTKDVVRNEGLFFNIKSKDITPTSTVLVPNVKLTPKTNIPEDKDLDGIQIPPHIAEAQAEFLKRRKQQMEGKTVQEQVQDLSDKRDELIETIEKENIAKGMTRKEAMRYNYNTDPRITEINRQIAQLNGGAALKVSNNLSADNIVDINTFVNWVQRTLPEFISVEDLKIMRNRMKSEGITVGMFYAHMNELNKRLEGKIAVGKESPFKYHEAFHAVFRMLLSDQQIEKYYDIARKELLAQGKNIEALKKELLETKPSLYTRLSDKQLEERVYEEYLADKFDAWKSNIKTPTSPVNKSLFRKLIDFIKSFFKRIKNSPLDELFSAIDRGKFKSNSVVRNRFTSGPQIGISEPALKAIQIGTRVITNEDGDKEVIPIFLGQEEGEKLVSTISAVYHLRMQRAGLSTHSEDIMDDILADYLNLYDRDTNPYYSSDAFLDRYEEGGSLALDKAYKRIDNLAKVFRNPELRSVLKDAIKVHTNIMGYKGELETELYDEMVDEYGDRVTTDNWKETYSIGGYGSLSKELRQYLGTIVEDSADEFGNTVFIKDDGTATEEPLVEAVNANLLYNGILKAVEGSVDQNQILNRLSIFAQYNPEARKFWNKFSSEVDLQFDEDGNFVDIGNKQQANLFQAVVKGFQQFSVDYFFINKDIGKKETNIIEANRKGAAKNQFSIWYNAYLVMFVEQFENVSKDSQALSAFIKKKTASLDRLSTVLKKGNKKLSKESLDTQIETIIVSMRNELGINLSPLFLKYSYLNSLDINDLTDEERKIVKAFEGVDTMTEEDAREIASIIRAGKNPFGSNVDPDKLAESEEQLAKMANEYKSETPEDDDNEENEKEVEDDIDGAIGRITKIAAANAVFDEQVATTSYKNAEGEIVYSHQLPTYDLVRTAQLQSEELRNDLKKDPFLRTNYLLNNPLFNYIADSLKISRIDGIKDSSLKRTDTGTLVEDKQLNVNQNTGVTYGSMSDREFLISLFELYGKNKKYVIPATDKQPRKEFMTSAVLLGVLEASNTADLLNLPVVRAVEYLKGNIVLTKEVKSILLEEVKREYDRINRVQNEINNGFPNGVIEGYHNGDPNNKSNPGMRGLRFIKTGNMLGKLADTLAKGARNNANFDAYVEDVLDAVEKYWLGPSGQIDQMRDLMIDLNIVNRTEKDKLENNLLNKYIFSGFKNTQNKVDVDRNKMLNILPEAVEHNLAQVLLSNYVNTLSARQLYIGDAAENYKDDGGIDEVKRNKGLNGSGSSIASIITSSQLGINHTNQKSHVVTIEDPIYDGKFAGKKKQKADAQMWMTVKSLRYTLFGLGKLNKAQAELLDKIENGENVTVDDIFGELYKDQDGRTRKRGGSLEYNAQTNSIKLVYNDGEKYIKTSGVLLTKQLTAIGRGNNWVARPGYEELDALRLRLEQFEAANNTITMAIPKSASKGLKKNIAKDVFSIQDDNFIEHDNNFWRLQLENPSNKITITDPSQAKQLIIAEQSRDLIVNFQGQEMTIGEVIDGYLKDTQQRIKNNYFSARDEMFDVDTAFQELGKSLKQSKITPKLGKFLQRAVEQLSAIGADGQLLEFFQPQINTQTGELTPKYNLNHPITLDKFTQLFLSYFSKGVMSEKIPGHSLAIMSNYGVKVVKRVIELDDNGQPKRWDVITRRQYEKDRTLLSEIKNAKRWNNELDRVFQNLSIGDYYIDDLRHNVPEYDKKGNITGYFTEFMMPPHFREHMSQYNTDGTISDSAKNTFAVRIPSQDKHSFVTGKLVDFMPAFYGSTAVFPHELIEISGADFDIDKLYMQVYDSYRVGNTLVAYGTAETPKGKFAEFVNYKVENDKQFKNKMKELYGLKPDAQAPDIILGNLEPSIAYEDFNELTEDLFSNKKTIKQVVIQNALRELGLPTTPAEYIKLVNDGIELNNGVLNNRILDAKIKLLNNEKIVTPQQGETPIGFQVSEVQPLIDSINSFIERFPILHSILVETRSDVDSMLGQYKAFKNNKEGARNIGPAVNAMLVYSVMNAFKVKVREKNTKGSLFVLTIDGHSFDSYEHSKAFVNRSEVGPNGSVKMVGDYSGERIFYHISAIVSAMTDNAKERLAARLGLNIDAVGVVSNMVALGVPLETALMFNLQPSVREFYKKISVSKNNIKTKKELNIYRSLVGEKIIEELSKKVGENSQDYEVTTDLLEKNIKSNGDNAAVDLTIFRSFLEFYKQSDYYSSIAQILKLSQGLGTSNEAIDKVDAKEEMLGLNMSDLEFADSQIPFDLRQILTGKNPYQPFHEITSTYIKIKNQIKELQKSIFIEKTYIFQRLRETVLANMQVNRKENERFNITLKRDIIAYLGIKTYMQQLKSTGKQVKLAGLDNAMIYDQGAIERGDGFLDIIDTVKSIRQTLPNNYFAKKFLNIIPTKIFDVATNKAYINPKSKAGINIAESNTWARLNTYEQNKLEDSFLEIYADPKTRHLAYNLFNYIIVKDGGQFKSGSFIKFIPPAMFKELLDATGVAHELLKQDSLVNNDSLYKEVFGVTAKDLFNEFTSLYSTNVNNTFNIPGIYKNGTPSADVQEKRPKNYIPEVMFFSKDKSRLSLDLFGGIRKPEMTLLEDEYGNEYYAETIASGKFSPEEIDKFAYNKEVIKSKGFKLVNKPDDKGNNRYYIGLPLTIKVNHGTSNFPDTVYYKLVSTGKKKNKNQLVTKTGEIITREELKKNPTIMYLFGDNDQRTGLGGQAKEMRGEPNAFGISTKKRPSNDLNAFKSDEELEDNKKIITADIEKILDAWRTGKYTGVVIPPIGVGLAKLREKAPKTFQFLQEELKSLEKEINSFVSLTGVGTFIKEIGDTIATSNMAIYERFEPLGSRKQWKAGGVTGKQPTALALRKRSIDNNPEFGLDSNRLESALDAIDNMLSNVSPVLYSEAARDLSYEWGISLRFVSNKLTYYKTVNGKEEVYKTEAESPERLLEILRETAPSSPLENDNPNVMENVDKGLKKSTELTNFDALGSVYVDPEEAKRNLQKLLAAKKIKKEIDDRKKEDDKGCESPV